MPSGHEVLRHLAYYNKDEEGSQAGTVNRNEVREIMGGLQITLDPGGVVRFQELLSTSYLRRQTKVGFEEST